MFWKIQHANESMRGEVVWHSGGDFEFAAGNADGIVVAGA